MAMLQLENKNNFETGQISAAICLIVDRIVGGKEGCSNITVHRLLYITTQLSVL